MPEFIYFFLDCFLGLIQSHCSWGGGEGGGELRWQGTKREEKEVAGERRGER